MAIAFLCPHCKKRVGAREDFAGMQVKCPSCGQVFVLPAVLPATQSQPQIVAAAPAVASGFQPIASSPSSVPPAAGSAQSEPYFTALAVFMCKRNRLYRVYIRPDELVFIWAGSGSEGVAGAHAGGAAHGVLGALIGALFAKLLDPSKKNAARKAVLDSTPLDELVDDNPMNLRAPLREFEEVRIGPRSARHAAGYSDHDHQALLYLRHQSLGKYRLGIASTEDVAVALRELPRIFGSLFKVEITWSAEKKKFVER